MLAGTRDSLVEATMVEGPRLGARLTAGAWEVELTGFLAPDAQRLTDTGRVELEVAQDDSAEHRVRPSDAPWAWPAACSAAPGVSPSGWSGSPVSSRLREPVRGGLAGL